jgi:hypothetical protein
MYAVTGITGKRRHAAISVVIRCPAPVPTPKGPCTLRFATPRFHSMATAAHAQIRSVSAVRMSDRTNGRGTDPQGATPPEIPSRQTPYATGGPRRVAPPRHVGEHRQPFKPGSVDVCSPATMICKIFYFGMIRPPQICLTH